MAQGGDDFYLDRFVAAQAGLYGQALAELKAGEKRSHWMWFIFPQIQGLGSSAMAVRYAIGSRAEAAAYLGHPLLGRRLVACTEAVLAVQGRSMEQIFGYPDDLKFHSSITLFAAVEADAVRIAGQVFTRALARYFAGQPDRATLARLGT